MSPRVRAALVLLALAAVSASAAADPGPIDREVVENAKRVVSVAATLLLGTGALLARSGRQSAHRGVRDALLLTLGALGGLCWWNLLQFQFHGFVHYPDTYHYYVGGKYQRELGYTGLYACTAVADLEDGQEQQVRARHLRNLATNEIETTARVLASPEACTDRFTPEAWASFRRDVAWFRDRVAPRRWAISQNDHGYNATPVWGVLGGALARTGPASDAQILALALLDPVLLAAMWIAVAWAFGWRTACVGLVFWGTNYLAPFGWTGGGYLRQGWLAASVGGICLLRRGRHAAGGFLLGVATLLRIFPGFLLAAIGIQAAADMAGRRSLRPSRAHNRAAAGALAAGVLLVPLSMWSAGGASAWVDFARNSALHLATPLRNDVGLQTVLSYRPSGRARLVTDESLSDPYARWKEIRQGTFERRQPIFLALVLAFVGLLAAAVRRREPWIAAVLGVGLVVTAVELTSYYYAVLLAYALLWPRHRWLGAALCGLSALGWGIVEIFGFYDEIFTWLSLACVVFALGATLAVAASPAADSNEPSGEESPV